jgi:hypothetical protein
MNALPLFISASLLIPLCGCVSTVHDLPPAAVAPMKPGLARIEIYRAKSMIGGATADYLIDLGASGERNGTMLQFPKLLKSVLGRPQDAEPLDTLLQVRRESRRGEGVVIHYLVGAHDVRIDRGISFNDPTIVRLGTPVKPNREGQLRIETLPFNVSVVGKIGAGGALIWDRSPGLVDLEIVSLEVGGLLIHPDGGKFTVEAGKTYRVAYKPSLKFEVSLVD